MADIRDEPGRTLGLSRGDGKEVVLDFQTGEVIECAVREDVGPLMGVVLATLDGLGWVHRRLVRPQLVTLPLARGGFRFDVALLTDEDTPLVMCLVSLPMRAPPQRLAAVGELLHRANWNHSDGQFELDYRDGEVRFKTALVLESGGLLEERITQLITGALGAAEWFHDAISRVAFGDVSAEAAIGELQSG